MITNNKDQTLKNTKKNYFISHSKLNTYQRKYCKCLMDIRPNLKKINENTNDKKKTKKNKIHQKMIHKNKKIRNITRQTPYGL